MDARLKRRRQSLKTLIQRQLVKLEESLGDVSHFITVRGTLEKKIALMEEINEEVISVVDEEEMEDAMIEAEEHLLDVRLQIGDLESSHQNTMNKTYPVQQQEEVPENRNNSTAIVSNASFSTPAFHKLPKLTLPTFCGSILEWQTFWDCFESSIHSNGSLSDVQKFCYLKSLLSEEAVGVIDGLPITNANYAEAVDLLKERYGQTHKIINAYMQALLDLPKPTSNMSSLRIFQEKLETYIRGLQSLGQGQESFGNLLIPVILQKLPPDIKRNMTRDHGGSDWQLSDMRRALKAELNILESSNPVENSREHVATASFVVGARSTQSKRQPPRMIDPFRKQKQRRCYFCSGDHNAVNCENISNPIERKNIIRQKKLCFNCLGKHVASSCSSTNRCKHCQRKHHTSICQQRNESKSQNIADSVTTESSSIQARIITDVESTTTFHSVTRGKNDVLLKTAVATVSSEKSQLESNILFDEGAQQSFITNELAEKLQLERLGSETVHLAAFGAKSDTLHHFDRATIHLHTDQSGKIAIDVLIVPTIATPIRNHIRAAANLPHLRGLNLAHPVSDNNTFNVELLIGADNYWRIVGDEVIRGDGPTAVQSKIGYLLSGPVTSSVTDRHDTRPL